MKIDKSLKADGYLSADEGAYSRQVSLIRQTGFWYNMCQWYFNNFEKQSEADRKKNCSFSDFEMEGEEDYSLCEIKADAPGYFDCLLPNELLSHVLKNKDTTATIKLIGAVNADSCACGCIVVRIKENNVCEIIWLYVADSIRHKGCGRLLLAAAMDEFKRAGATDVYFLSGRQKSAEDVSSVSRLSKNIGCKTSVVTEHFVAVEINHFLTNFGNAGSCSQCMFLYETPSKMIETYMNTLPEEDRIRMENLRKTRADEKGEIPPLYLAFSRESCVYIKDGKITGMLLYTGREDGEGITLVSMKSKDQMSLAQMMRFSIESAKKTYGGEGYLTFAALNGIGKAMGNYFKIEEGWIKVTCSCMTFV